MNPVSSSGPVAIGATRPGRGEGDPGPRQGQVAALSRGSRSAPSAAAPELVEGTGDPASLFAARVAPIAPSLVPHERDPIPQAIVGYRFNAPAIAVKMLDPAPVSR
ncbi:MAG: hypothetical protein KDK24_02010 [Pseudooceanicola sp.]|nr:hypothetical protein [Pseudooceanicola sp.]